MIYLGAIDRNKLQFFSSYKEVLIVGRKFTKQLSEVLRDKMLRGTAQIILLRSSATPSIRRVYIPFIFCCRLSQSSTARHMKSSGWGPHTTSCDGRDTRQILASRFQSDSQYTEVTHVVLIFKLITFLIGTKFFAHHATAYVGILITIKNEIFNV